MNKRIEDAKKQYENTAASLKELNEYATNNIKFDGKTILEWKKFFNVEIPEEVSFPVLIRLSREIAYKFQRAAYYRDVGLIEVSLLEQIKFKQYHETYNRARIETQERTGKPLAAESCKTAATIATIDVESDLNVQKVIKDFWVKMCDSLTEIRKLVELMGYALSADSRAQRDFIVRGDGKQ